MLVALALSIGLLHHHHKQKQTQPQPQYSNQRDVYAEMYESEVTGYVANVKQAAPNIPPLYFTAVENDLKKLAHEHSADLSFEQDLNELDADVRSLGYATRLYTDMDTI